METRPRLSLVTQPTPQQALQEAIDSFLRRGQARSLSRVRSDSTATDSARSRDTSTPTACGLLRAVTAQVVRDFLTAESDRVSAPRRTTAASR